MADELLAPPVLSTPADNLFEHARSQDKELSPNQHRPDQELFEVYEVPRTAREIVAGGWQRIALQFPDSMLSDASRVVEVLRAELDRLSLEDINSTSSRGDTEPITTSMITPGETRAQDESESPETRKTMEGYNGKVEDDKVERNRRPTQELGGRRLYIMADTSYSACCVDEVAAEHVAADVVVHYGRSCLSPTSRLPVIYVFTRQNLGYEDVAAAFELDFPDRGAKVVLMADVTYQDHVSILAERLRGLGYAGLLTTDIVRNPLSTIPNRKVLDREGKEVFVGSAVESRLADYSIFHISSPPTALLLALSCRVKSLHVFPTASSPDPASFSPSKPTTCVQSTSRLLGRRYARVLTVATAGIIGILVNTLSVSNYLSSLDNIRKQIAAAGKKSYTVVVGKLNPAKLANFAEVDGWVVVGCWESSLVEDDAGFFKPAITPFELEAALIGDQNRVWGNQWWGGIESIQTPSAQQEEAGQAHTQKHAEGEIDEEESEPPEFDFRTGRLVSRSRPMKAVSGSYTIDPADGETSAPSSALSVRPKGDLVMVNGVLSPGAEFLRSQRTWQGLGADFDPAETSTTIEEGRSGVARGYTAGQDPDRR